MFNISDKVVCVIDCIGDNLTTTNIPKKGEIFVISGLNINYAPNIGLQLVGAPAFNAKGFDCGWIYKKFRKLDDIKSENKLKNYEKTHCC